MKYAQKLQEMRAILGEAVKLKPAEIAANAFAEMKKQKKTKVAMVILDLTADKKSKELSVTDFSFSPYVVYEGDSYGRRDVLDVIKELQKLGVQKLKGKIYAGAE